MRPLVLFLILVAAASVRVPAQTPLPTFEVASIKPSSSGDASLRVQPGGRISAINTPLRDIIIWAYQLRFDDDRLLGLPERSQDGRGALDPEQYRAIFETGQISPALADELRRRRDEKEKAGHVNCAPGAERV